MYVQVCVSLVSPRFVANSLAVTVRAPNETNNPHFYLSRQRNEEEITTSSWVQISAVSLTVGTAGYTQLSVIAQNILYIKIH